jgi:DtxR family Mn-dependent transcriptional regulator
MEEFTGLELSPKKIEYVKFIQEQSGLVKTTDISSRFNVDPSTITKTVNELSSTGLIHHIPYRGIGLTEQGRIYAEFLVRRHRILSLVLTHYGLSADEACVAVSKFEGYITRAVVDKMCTTLGHPTMSVCGKIQADKCCCPCGDHI